MALHKATQLELGSPKEKEYRVTNQELLLAKLKLIKRDKVDK